MRTRHALSIREATSADVPFILSLIKELADYEKLSGDVIATEERLTAHLFGPNPRAEVLIGSIAGEPSGFALFFHNFSTFLAQPGIYLEDLYVKPGKRGLGLGEALLRHLAQLAIQRGCGRLEWAVLDWNEPAIGFYKRLGAVAMDEWTVYRVAGDMLQHVAAGKTS